MRYDFELKESKEDMASLLTNLNVLVPVGNKYSIGFLCTTGDYSRYYIRIYLDRGNEAVKIYESDYLYNENKDQIKKMVCMSDDHYWNTGLSIYRKEKSEQANVPEDESANELRKVKNEIASLHGINGVKYAKKHFSFKERLELRKLGYYDYVSDTGSYTFFEKILQKATNGDKVSFEKIKILLLGAKDYERNRSNNILYYCENFLSDSVLEKIYELSVLDSKTSNDLIDIKEMIDTERAEYNRICEITANKKKKDIDKLLETEKIQYMVNNGISLQEAFYHVDKFAQAKKEKILETYLHIVNNEDVSNVNEDIVYISKYLNDNIEKRFIETIIDYILIDDESIIDKTILSNEYLDHISFLKLKLRSDKDGTENKS